MASRLNADLVLDHGESRDGEPAQPCQSQEEVAVLLEAGGERPVEQ
jgi:hypothetical protein